MFPVCVPDALEQVQSIATAVGLVSGGRFVHAALIYRTTDGKLRFLHIGSSGQVLNHELKRSWSKFTWSIPDLPNMVLEDIADFCETMGNNPPKLSYRFKHTNDTKLVSEGTNFHIEGQSRGFTCATFVLTFFQSFNKPLLDLDTWKQREDDDSWIQQLIQMFDADRQAYGLTPNDIEEIKSELPCVRFRPQEVVASCNIGNHPTSFDETDPAGTTLENWLRNQN